MLELEGKQKGRWDMKRKVETHAGMCLMWKCLSYPSVSKSFINFWCAALLCDLVSIKSFSQSG